MRTTRKAGLAIWTEREDHVLRTQVALYGPEKGCIDASVLLGTRTLNACKIRAIKLGIRKPDGSEHYKRNFKMPGAPEGAPEYTVTSDEEAARFAEHETVEPPEEEAVEVPASEDDLVASILGDVHAPEPRDGAWYVEQLQAWCKQQQETIELIEGHLLSKRVGSDDHTSLSTQRLVRRQTASVIQNLLLGQPWNTQDPA